MYSCSKIFQDISTRIRADALGVTVSDYKSDKVNTDKLYTGFHEILVETSTLELISKTLLLPPELSKKSEELVSLDLPSQAPKSEVFDITALVKSHGVEPMPNEFIVFKDKAGISKNIIGRWKRTKPKVDYDQQDSTPIFEPKWFHLSPRAAKVWNVESHSQEQMMALEVLMDPSVKLVTLIGQAGTGKTLLAVAAALEQVFRYNRHERILITRPIMPMGKDIGYLPGHKDEKLLPKNLYFRYCNASP